MWKWVMGAMLLGAGSVAVAGDKQTTPPKLTLETVFGSPDLNGSAPQGMRLSPDGRYLTLLRNRDDERARFDLWAYEIASGTWRMLVDSKLVGTGAEPTEAEKMQRERNRTLTGKTGILSYDWSPDGRTILVPLDGDLYLATVDGKVRRLTDTPGGELNPGISPAGGYVSFVRDQNLVVMDLATGKAVQVTDDGAGTVHWGEAEFVADEEMDRRTGYWWAPGDKRIAVARYDEAPVGIVSRAAIGAEGTTVYNQRYPKAGTANVLIDLYVMNPDGSGRVRVDLGADRDIYLARVSWLADGALLVQRQNRAQTLLDVLRVDPATGKAVVLFSETAKPRSWINLSASPRSLNDGSLIWWSERDGHGHLYRWKAGRFTQLTRGNWDVASVVGVDAASGRVTFLGNRDGVLERHLYTLDLAKPGEVTRLTDAGWWHAAVMDDSGTRLIVTRSNPVQPPQTYLADALGKRLAWINENALVEGHPYQPYLAAHRERTFGTIKAEDGTTLHWEMIVPVMEPGKRYPVFFQHYGGPHSQTVSKAWGGALQQYLVSRGYIWFQLDNRGSANRGKVFEDALYQAMGSVEVRDQVAGATYLKTLDFVDPKRVFTYGWSYGGYMTLKMLQAAPGVFAAGVAGAPVTNWELYDTHYTERYMGDPRLVPDAYMRSNTLADALKITDPLLIVHGMSDDNVVFEHSTVMMARMQAGARPFEVMVYPGQAHGVRGPGVSVHLWMTILGFLERSAR